MKLVLGALASLAMAHECHHEKMIKNNQPKFLLEDGSFGEPNIFTAHNAGTARPI
jgi:hypothetical protein